MSTLALTGVSLYQVMFAHSGLDKLKGFDKKVDTLLRKVRERTTPTIPRELANLGMIGVILLEIVGSLYLVMYAIRKALVREPVSSIWKNVARLTIIMMIVFVIVVTYLYHYPDKRIIPMLSNLTTTAGFLLMWDALEL